MADREKLIELVHNARMNALWHNAQKPSEYITDMLIEDGVTVRERGRWVPKTYDYGMGEFTLYHCPKCDTPNALERNFCHNCGADMRGEEDG